MNNLEIFKLIIVISYYLGIGILLSIFFRWIVCKLEIDLLLDTIFKYIKNKYISFRNN